MNSCSTGNFIGHYTAVHIPDILTWEGLRQMICLGNLLVFLDALDYQNYLDLRTPSVDDLSGEQITAEITRRAVYQTQRKLARKEFTEFRIWFQKNYTVEAAMGKENFVDSLFYVSDISL
jgi:hypothetical protein